MFHVSIADVDESFRDTECTACGHTNFTLKSIDLPGGVALAQFNYACDRCKTLASRVYAPKGDNGIEYGLEITQAPTADEPPTEPIPDGDNE